MHAVMEKLGIVFGGKGAFWIVIGGGLLALLGNAAYEIARGHMSAGQVLTVAMCVALLLAVSIKWQYELAARSSRRHFRIEGATAPPKKRGLICLVSNGMAIMEAVEYHKPALESLWLVHTPESKAQASSVEAAVTQVYAEGRAPLIQLVPIINAVDHRDTEQAVDGIYAALRDNMTEADVIADLTEGNKAMTAGMVMACLDAERALEYVPQEHRTATDGRPERTGRVYEPVYLHIVYQDQT